MNIRETASIRSPNGIDEKCAKFIIDEVGNPFVFRFTTNENQRYAFSSWVRAEADSTIIVDSKEIPVTTEWQRIKVEYKASSSSLKLYFNQVGTYYFYKSQLEIGNISTDWSPAPEDIEASLEVKVNTKDLISEINASANVIRLKSNRLVVKSDNLEIDEDGTLKTKKGEIGGFVLNDNILSAEVDRFAEINIKYHTHADAEPREGFIQIGNDAENEGGTGEAGIFVKDYDLDGNGIFTRIGNVLGGGILIETEERNDALHIYDKGVARVDGKAVRINGMEYGVNKVLVDCGEYMSASQTVTLPEEISSQPHGIVLVFSYFSSNVAQNWNFHYFFIPKQHISSFGACGVDFHLVANGGVFGHKYLYIYDTQIKGHEKNIGTQVLGNITIANNSWVLRQVIGV